MILSVEKLKEFITTDEPDEILEARLQAIETSIRNKTHNNFQDRRYRTYGKVTSNHIEVENRNFFEIGDTVMINDDLCVLTGRSLNLFTIDKTLLDSDKALMTKVVYPKDIIIGVVDVMSWMLANPSSKAGIASETLSRHSVSYQGNSEYDADIGCPVRLLSFLNQYKKARF